MHHRGAVPLIKMQKSFLVVWALKACHIFFSIKRANQLRGRQCRAANWELASQSDRQREGGGEGREGEMERKRERVKERGREAETKTERLRPLLINAYPSVFYVFFPIFCTFVLFSPSFSPSFSLFISFFSLVWGRLITVTRSSDVAFRKLFTSP